MAWTGRPKSMFAGLLPAKRMRRQLVMIRFQAYIDESGINQPPVYVMAGFVGLVSGWASFSEEWQQALDSSPKLKFFRYREARTLSGEFSQFNKKQRDDRVSVFVSIINKYAAVGISVFLQHDEYNDAFPEKRMKKLFPSYFIMFFYLLRIYTTQWINIAREHAWPIEFIFDSRPEQMRTILYAWECFRGISPPDIQHLLISPPKFCSYQETFPLQAADLHAWFLRRNLENEIRGNPEKAISINGLTTLAKTVRCDLSTLICNATL